MIIFNDPMGPAFFFHPLWREIRMFPIMLFYKYSWDKQPRAEAFSQLPNYTLRGKKKIPRIGIAESGICSFSKAVDPSCQKALWKTFPLCLPQQFKKTPVFHTLTYSRFHKIFQPSVCTFSGKHITLLLCLDPGLTGQKPWDRGEMAR